MNSKSLKVNKMLIKICGITKLEEIEAINLLKPEYIGFVFAESKRRVDAKEVRILFDKLDKAIKTVGVFRNNSKQFIIDVLEQIPLYAIQLHGDEDEEFILDLKTKVKCEIWKAVSVKSEQDLKDALNYPVETLVLDGSNPGSGQIFPWKYLDNTKFTKRVFLAGGINEENVLEAIEKVKPNGIDLSSGVEIITNEGIRIKSKEKMKNLIDKVRSNNER
jgi:phosphoribosylanthranilate isomerase